MSKSEAARQQQVRMKAAQAGWALWRNNVGATPARCPDCGVRQRPVRYGLANDSIRVNTLIKSSDLIGIRPVLITKDMVGHTIGQFASIEVKRPGWSNHSTPREQAQGAWLDLIIAKGGYAIFSTGEL